MSDYYTEAEVSPGTRLRARREVSALSFRDGCRSRERLRPGTEVTFQGRGYGLGSDAAFEVRIQLLDGRPLQVDVGWCHLRRADWEVIPREGLLDGVTRELG